MPDLWKLMTDGFMPHGFCLRWDGPLLTVFILGNLGIAIAYFLIPLALRHFIGQRRDLPYPHMFKLFAAFILSCGFTHLVKIWTIYQPVYWVEALLDLFTAVVSLVTAALLFPLIPQALKLRSPRELEKANEDLRAAQEELEAAKESLEIQVLERTAELSEAVKKARADEEMFRQLFDMMPELGWTAKADGYIDHYSKGWYDYTGTTMKDMEGWGWESLHDPELLPAVKKAWQHSLETGSPFEMKFPLMGVNNEFQWFLSRINPIKDADGKLIRWVGINANIQGEVDQAGLLERLVQERTGELEAAKVLAEQALETKKRVLATVSHEVRTPLAGIIGLTEILSFQDFGGDMNLMINAVLSSAKRLLRILNDLLDASKIEAGKVHIEHMQFPVRTLIGDITQLIAVEASKKELEVVPSCDEKIPELVWGDELRVRQVLLNLAFNAVKFTEKGYVKVSAVLKEASEKVTVVRFTVVDSGIGISPEHQSRLFLPFEQAEKSTNRVYGGTGLGLSISKNLVELMGGEIGVSSEPEGGSTFWFEIPFYVAAPAQADRDMDNSRSNNG